MFEGLITNIIKEKLY